MAEIYQEMQLFEVKIGSFSVQIESSDAQKLNEVVCIINTKIAKIKEHNANITDLKAILLTVIMLQNDIMAHTSHDNCSMQHILNSINEVSSMLSCTIQ